MDLPDAQCLVCTRPFSLQPAMTDSLESLAICGECKFMVSNPNTQEREHSVPSRYMHPNSHRRTGSRRHNTQHSRTGSLDNSDPESFAIAFSQLINSARQSQSSTPNQSNRWSVLLSDTESDVQDVMDTSNFGESESNLSFGGYGGDSDASFDRHSVADRENLLLSNDLGIDPMQVGLSAPDWDSYTEDEDASEWEEVSEWDDTAGPTVETPPQRPARYYVFSPSTEERLSQSLNPQWMRSHWRMGPLEIDIRQPFDGDPPQYVVDDFTDQFEDILEPLPDDTDDVRRGATPTSRNYQEKLPHVTVTLEHVRDKGGLICAVCKDPMQVKSRVLQLPCKHMYHPGCIRPWLCTKNTCPVCRYELPIEDPDYDRSRREETEGISYDTNGEEIEIEEDEYEEEITVVETDNEGARVDSWHHAVERSNGEGGVRNRWLFLAAAPIVSLVGIVLVFCFRNSSVRNRIGGESREGGIRPESVSDDSRKRWWSIL